ncbi:MAG: hypothetical protein EA426_18535 [Spirochaetaceae bacterium]|nr:MAG: hypothetical protein EA382_00090 [Spirochaetaceae bacterium]TVR52788.1 MAG: hypothetical protein EA426_18535 [Spirochaetaceae bacterium]
MTVVEKLERNGIRVDLSRVEQIARRHQIREISVFGSAIREDIRDDSDVDLLLSFQPDAHPSLFDLMDIENELSAIFGRQVDVVEVEGLTNPIRRRAILASTEPLYAA